MVARWNHGEVKQYQDETKLKVKCIFYLVCFLFLYFSTHPNLLRTSQFMIFKKISNPPNYSVPPTITSGDVCMYVCNLLFKDGISKIH